MRGWKIFLNLEWRIQKRVMYTLKVIRPSTSAAKGGQCLLAYERCDVAIPDVNVAVDALVVSSFVADMLKG